MRPTRSRLLFSMPVLALGCEPKAPVRPGASVAATTSSARTSSAAVAAPSPAAAAPSSHLAAVPPVIAPPQCSPADWTARALPPLLERGKGAPSARANQASSQTTRLDQCTDSPEGAAAPATEAHVIDGVQVQVRSVTQAGKSGRNWTGNRCTFELRLADGSGAAVALGEEQVPPFNTVTAIVRSGSAAWVSVGFNGYTKEFPGGGNRVVAVDLCTGRVMWQSKDGVSNGGLLLVDDYLIAPFGFTSERRFVHVLDARSGALVQKLPVVENVCPSRSWAPNWRPGERCDAPGQAVGAATQPRIEDGLFFVDTNTGSAAFHFKAPLQ